MCGEIAMYEVGSQQALMDGRVEQRTGRQSQNEGPAKTAQHGHHGIAFAIAGHRRFLSLRYKSQWLVLLAFQ